MVIAHGTDWWVHVHRATCRYSYHAIIYWRSVTPAASVMTLTADGLKIGSFVFLCMTCSCTVHLLLLFTWTCVVIHIHEHEQLYMYMHSTVTQHVHVRTLRIECVLRQMYMHVGIELWRIKRTKANSRYCILKWHKSKSACDLYLILFDKSNWPITALLNATASVTRRYQQERTLQDWP